MASLDMKPEAILSFGSSPAPEQLNSTEQAHQMGGARRISEVIPPEVVSSCVVPQAVTSSSVAPGTKQAAKTSKATPAAARKPRGKYKTKKQPQKLIKPKRALSAYNYFFRYERARLLGCEPPCFENDDSSDEAGIGDSRYTVTKRRPHRKTHGQIGFTDLAKHIGTVWKQLEPDSRSFFEELAAKDLKRYRADLATYKHLVATAKLNGDNIVAPTKAEAKKIASAQKAKSSSASKAPKKVTPKKEKKVQKKQTATLAAVPENVASSSALHCAPECLPVVPIPSCSMPSPEPVSSAVDISRAVDVASVVSMETEESDSSTSGDEMYPVLSGTESCDPLSLFGGPLEPLFSMDDSTVETVESVTTGAAPSVAKFDGSESPTWGNFDDMGDLHFDSSSDELLDLLCQNQQS